jgi:hypothetical protein
MFAVWRSLTDRFGVDLFCRLFLETTSYENRFSKPGAQFTFSQRRHGTKSQMKLQDCLCARPRCVGHLSFKCGARDAESDCVELFDGGVLYSNGQRGSAHRKL